MVLEIRLSNFFSIKDEITIDFRGANLRSRLAQNLSDHVFEFNKTSVLKALAFYGANASGKSNIIKAIRFCILMIINSHNHNEDAVFNFLPFKFDGYSEKPSKFFIHFVLQGVEYKYSFELNRNQILKESLVFYPNGRVTKIFERNEEAGETKKEKYSFGKFIKRPFDVAESTSVKTLFVSRASQMDREIPKNVFSFFKEKFRFTPILLSEQEIEYYFEKYKKEFLTGVRIADSDIVDIKLEKNIIPVKNDEITNGEIAETTTSASTKLEERIGFFSYHKRDTNLKFDFLAEESAGTRRLFLLLLTVLDVANNNKILLVDEIENSLHPQIVEYIVNLFYKSKYAQLLFTTHNTYLLDLKKIRKDQIYFCNKREDASTEVYSLYDFSDFRDTMDVEKAYLLGRFGAIPFLDDSKENLKILVHEQ